MCFLVAALVLIIALLTGAFIAPHPGIGQGLGLDPCALDTGEWTMLDPNCSSMQAGTAFQTMGRGSMTTATRLPKLTPGDLIAR